jgi:hypothetical protein
LRQENRGKEKREKRKEKKKREEEREGEAQRAMIVEPTNALLRAAGSDPWLEGSCSLR